MSLFYAELLDHLLLEEEQKCALQKELHAGIPLPEILAQIRLEKQPQQLEKKLLEAFPALKMLRGLPRLYHRDNPAESFIKTEFTDLASLKKLAEEKFLLPTVENTPLPKGAKITLFTWMIADGWGDWIAHQEIKAILQERFPDANIQSVIFAHTQFASSCKAEFVIPYQIKCPPQFLPDEALDALCASDLIFSFPTFYPHTAELLEMLQPMQSQKPPPRFLALGEYGFIESSRFHPKSGHSCMGLHFLEKGILIRKKTILPRFQDIENQELLASLFGTASPQEQDIAQYLATHKLYLAYLLSPTGGAIYLHALLALHEGQTQTIDICTPNIDWLMSYAKQRNQPFFEGHHGISKIEIHWDGKIQIIKFSERGKKMRILCPTALSDADFRRLIRLSEEFIAIRGNQSFSEVVSADRLFFYDGAPHARYFIKDLAALAENRLASHKSALTLFRCMSKAFLYNLPEETDQTWVDETFFQEKEPWLEIAKTIAKALKNPETLAGFKKFNQIIKTEYCCNQTICQLVQREFSTDKINDGNDVTI